MPTFSAPVKGVGISTDYGETGTHWSYKCIPDLGCGRFHTGADYAAPTGTEVYAVGDGLIIPTSWHDSYGNYVEISHSGGVVSRVAHLSKKFARFGFVKRGEVVGLVGETGNTTGPHVHLEFLINGQWTDPKKYLSGIGIPPGERVPNLPDTGGGANLDIVSDPNTWVRVGTFIGGVALAGVGLYFVWVNI